MLVLKKKSSKFHCREKGISVVAADAALLAKAEIVHMHLVALDGKSTTETEEDTKDDIKKGTVLFLLQTLVQTAACYCSTLQSIIYSFGQEHLRLWLLM